jgi:hypothetical protein
MEWFIVPEIIHNVLEFPCIHMYIPEGTSYNPLGMNTLP